MPPVTHAVYGHSVPVNRPTLRERIGPKLNNMGQLARLDYLLDARVQFREYLAEFIGTFILMILGSGISSVSNLQVPAGALPTDLGCLFWGFAVMVAVYVNGGVSGGHNNPAVTIAFACWRGFPWRKVPGYWFSQIFGAFCATGVLYLMYEPDIDLKNQGERTLLGPNQTAAIYFTIVDPVRGNYSCFFAEIIGTASLTMLIFAAVDRYNVPPTHCSPIVFGLAVAVILAAFNSPGALAINPARDFGPRMLMSAAGYGGTIFSAYDGYAWVPVVGPLIGGSLGGAVYDLFIATGPDPEEVYDPKSF